MTTQLQWVAGILLVLAFLWIINMIRRRKLELKHALSWLLVLLCLLIVDLFPSILRVLSYLLGIATPVNTLFLLGFVFSIGLLFVMTVSLSRLSEKSRKLAQKMALYEKKLENLEAELEKNRE